MEAVSTEQSLACIAAFAPTQQPPPIFLTICEVASLPSQTSKHPFKHFSSFITNIRVSPLWPTVGSSFISSVLGLHFLSKDGNVKIKNDGRASQVVQWLRICLPMQGTRVRALGWEDPTCRGATRPVSHNYWACASGACAPQQERPR